MDLLGKLSGHEGYHAPAFATSLSLRISLHSRCRQPPSPANQAASEREAEEAAVPLCGTGDRPGNHKQKHKAQSGAMQTACKELWNPKLDLLQDGQPADGDPSRHVLLPLQPVRNHASREMQPSVSCLASHHFSDVPGMVQWSACIYSFYFFLY